MTEAINEIVSCFYCDDPATTLDHFIPRALYKPRDKAMRFALPPGAGNRIPPKRLNKVPACESCNKAKGQLDPRDWLRLCPLAGTLRVQARLEQLEAYLPPRDSLRPAPRQMPPPPRSIQPSGPAKSLREYAAKYLELKGKAGE